MDALNIVNRYLSIMLLENKAGEGLLDLITPDFTFNDPFTQASTAQEFVAKTKAWIRTPKTLTSEADFVNGDRVCKTYTLHVTVPSGGIIDFPVADVFELREGKLAKEKVYFFEPHTFAQAFGLEP